MSIFDEPQWRRVRDRQVLAEELMLSNLEDKVAWIEAHGGTVSWSGMDDTGFPAIALETTDGQTLARVGDYVVYEPDRPGTGWRVLSKELFRYEFK